MLSGWISALDHTLGALDHTLGSLDHTLGALDRTHASIRSSQGSAFMRWCLGVYGSALDRMASALEHTSRIENAFNFLATFALRPKFSLSNLQNTKTNQKH